MIFKFEKYIIAYLLICLVKCLFLVGWSDHNYPNMTYGEWEELAPGARIRNAVHSSPDWELWVVEVDMDERNIDLVPVHSTPVSPTSVIGREAGAVAAMNAGFFNMSTGEAIFYLEIDGNVKNSWGDDKTTFGLTGDKREHFVITRVDVGGDSDHPHWENVIDAIGGGPNLVTDGKVNITDEGFGWEYQRHPRSSLGYNQDERLLYLVTVDGRSETSVGMTLPELADFFLDLGCDYAMNYDGGGSTTMWADGAVKNNPADGFQRSVPTVWAVVPRYLIDWDDGECHRAGNWETVSYDNSYNQHSLRITGGDTLASVTWTPELARPGVYEVYIWYVSLPSCSEEVPYTVQDAIGTQTVMVDQTRRGGQWKSLGTFAFEEGTAGSVSVNNVADSSKDVIADAVYFHFRGDGMGEYIIDNRDEDQVEYSDGWWSSSFGIPWEDDYYVCNAGNEDIFFRWKLTIPRSGMYEVYAWWVAGNNRETNVRYEIEHGRGSDVVIQNQRTDGAQWNSLGTYYFVQDQTGSVTVTGHGSSPDIIVADAVKFSLQEIEEPNYDSELMNMDIPHRMRRGDEKEVSLTFKNTGNMTWRMQDRVYLGAVGDEDPFVSHDSVRVGYTDDIVPGGEGTFSIPFQAPEDAMKYVTEWQMLKEGDFWFGEKVSSEIEVIGQTMIQGDHWQLFQ